MVLGNFPALFQLDEWQTVRRVAVDFIRAREEEDGLGAVLPGGFEEVHRAEGVDTEVNQGRARGPIVRGLRGGMDDDLHGTAELAKERRNALRIADIEWAVPVAGKLAGQLLARGCGRGAGTEEFGPHVIVDADDIEAFRGESAAGLGTDQSGGAGDDGNHRNPL